MLYVECTPPTKSSKTDQPKMVYERIVQLLETLTEKVSYQITIFDEYFRIIERHLDKIEASSRHFVDKFDVVDVCSKNLESQERQSTDDLISAKQGESFQEKPWRIKQGEFKEEVCAPELPASDEDSKIESSEIVEPMMTLVSCPLTESRFSKGEKGVTDQLEFLQPIDSSGFRRQKMSLYVCTLIPAFLNVTTILTRLS
ncbi:unnamed protein product [Prunus armeniaca]|uniref:Uncharacterized protein n=1 Tax=Prunus armeniaca TaxID=36596 RepID=A0A6J5UHX9_PRUAR|nr:unnamed protein product [Prunus armeniaca]